MNKIPTELNLDFLCHEVKKLSFWKDGSGAYMSFSQSAPIPDQVMQSSVLYEAIMEIASIRKQEPRSLMVNIIPPLTSVPMHSDTLIGTRHQPQAPRLERWHLPLKTNVECAWWDEGNRKVNMELGYWYGPVPYWLQHKVWNMGAEERIHLVVDLDTPERLK